MKLKAVCLPVKTCQSGASPVNDRWITLCTLNDAIQDPSHFSLTRPHHVHNQSTHIQNRYILSANYNLNILSKLYVFRIQDPQKFISPPYNVYTFYRIKWKSVSIYTPKRPPKLSLASHFIPHDKVQLSLHLGQDISTNAKRPPTPEPDTFD
jgi:hypothetical protein